VNRPLSHKGWKVYQAAWGKIVTIEEWEAMPGNVRTPEAFESYLELNGVPPCTYLTVARTPGAPVVYVGYLLAFIGLIALMVFRQPKAGGK
jgi:cytochrome c biogenesis protein ResB